MPSMSSVFSPYTGMRDMPLSIARSMHSATVASAPTVTMSVRGTMISRTTVSPKSMIDSIRSRSDSSMTACSMASSARARISSSVTNGPFFRPLPGRITLATPMRARAGMRSTQPANSTMGAVNNAARSVCCNAQVFGAASAITNSTRTFNTMPIATPAAPNRLAASTPTRADWIVWTMLTDR